MELILKKTVDTLGEEGDIVQVKPGFGRNYLIPKKMAVIANKANLILLEQEKAVIETRKEKQRQEAETQSKKISGTSITIEHRVGSVTAADIAEKLAELDIQIDKKNILLPESIKTLGEVVVPIKVGFQTTSEITVSIVPLETE